VGNVGRVQCVDSVGSVQCVGRVQCVFITQLNKVSAKRINAGSSGSHLISYFAVLFSSIMTWG
jgi:hypothetical protein